MHRIPISTFHQLAEEAGAPDSNGVTLGVIGMTVRCGSTLLSQIMHRAEGTRLVHVLFKITHIFEFCRFSTGPCLSPVPWTVFGFCTVLGKLVWMN